MSVTSKPTRMLTTFRMTINTDSWAETLTHVTPQTYYHHSIILSQLCPCSYTSVTDMNLTLHNLYTTGPTAHCKTPV